MIAINAKKTVEFKVLWRSNNDFEVAVKTFVRKASWLVSKTPVGKGNLAVCRRHSSCIFDRLSSTGFFGGHYLCRPMLVRNSSCAPLLPSLRRFGCCPSVGTYFPRSLSLFYVNGILDPKIES